MKKLMLLSVLLIGCSLTPDILFNHSGSTRIMQANDYSTNLVDWWVSTRGPVIHSSNTYVDEWRGYANNRILTQAGTPLFPVADGSFDLDGNDAFKFVSTAITTPSIAFMVKKTSKRFSANPLFDSNTGTPRLKLFLELSGTNSHIGFSYNSITYDTGHDFIYDGQKHTLIFTLGSNVATVWLDGVQISEHTVTGGALVWNAQTLWFFRALSPQGSYADMNVEAMRLYNEKLSESAVLDITSSLFSNGAIIDNTPVHFWWIAGQSNCGPSLNINEYPVTMSSGFPDDILWDHVSNNNVFIPILANTNIYLAGSYPVKPGPFLSVIYNTYQQFPGEQVKVFEIYKDATSLALSWISGGTLRNKLLLSGKSAYLTATLIEKRNIVEKKFLWIQGEKDATDLTWSNAYYNNLVSLDNDVRSAFGSDVVTIISALSANSEESGKPGKWIVRDAQEQFVALDTVKHKLINTDDAARFPLNSGVHYYVTGHINIGLDAVLK